MGRRKPCASSRTRSLLASWGEGVICRGVTRRLAGARGRLQGLVTGSGFLLPGKYDPPAERYRPRTVLSDGSLLCQPDRHVQEIGQGGALGLEPPRADATQACSKAAVVRMRDDTFDHRDRRAALPAQGGPSRSREQRRDVAFSPASTFHQQPSDHVHGPLRVAGGGSPGGDRDWDRRSGARWSFPLGATAPGFRGLLLCLAGLDYLQLGRAIRGQLGRAVRRDIADDRRWELGAPGRRRCGRR